MGYCNTPGCTLRNCDPSTPKDANYDPKINGAFYKNPRLNEPPTPQAPPNIKNSLKKQNLEDKTQSQPS